jgi:ribonuclease HI
MNEAWIDGSSIGMYGYQIGNETFIIKENAPMTNNVAEWMALYALIVDLPDDWKGVVYSDSQLVVYQYAGIYKIKDLELRRIHDMSKSLAYQKRLVIEVSWIPREQNPVGKRLDKELAKERKKRWKARER